MQQMAEGRTEFAAPISGFVVAEDHSFEARMRRQFEAFRIEASHLIAHARSKADGWPLRGQLADLWQAVAAFATLFAHAFRPVQSSRQAKVARPDQPTQTIKSLTSARLRPGRRFFALVIFLALSALALAAAILLPEQEMPEVALRAQLSASQPMSNAPATGGAPATREALPLVTLSSLEAQSWQAVRRPIPMFHLESPELEGMDFAYAVFTRGKGARLDTLSWAPKTETQNRPRIHLVVERYERDQPAQKPLFADVAARASERHVTLERMAGAIDVPSKFGILQTADATLTHDGQPSACLVFRRVDMSGLTLAGWYCGTTAKPADRVSLTCFLDRLDLLGAGQDQDLKRYFSAAERNRSTCASARQSGRKITWMDHEAPIPPLKLSAKKH